MRGRFGCTQRPFIVRTGQRRAQTGREASWAAGVRGEERDPSQGESAAERAGSV